MPACDAQTEALTDRQPENIMPSTHLLVGRGTDRKMFALHAADAQVIHENLKYSNMLTQW